MQILRHANFKITMEIYTQVTDQQTRDALKRLGKASDDGVLLYFAAVLGHFGALDRRTYGL